MPAQGWTVQCGNATAAGMSCRATQAIMVANTRQLVVLVAVTKAVEPATGYAITLQLPHGLFLPAGASIEVTPDPLQPAIIETCDPKGCYATLPLPETTVAAMQAGKLMTVAFQNLKKQTIKVQLPLEGFSEAIKKL